MSDGDGCAIGKTESKLNKFPRSERRCKKLCGLLIRSELYGHVYINLARECVRAKLTTSLRLARPHNDNCDCAAARHSGTETRQREAVKMLLLFSQFRWHMQQYDRAVSARPHHHHHEGALPPAPAPFLTTNTCCDNNV